MTMTEVEVERTTLMKAELIRLATLWSALENDHLEKWDNKSTLSRKQMLLTECLVNLESIDQTAGAIAGHIIDKTFGNDEEGLHGNASNQS